MGVPSFYRWLANRYPKVVVNAVEKAEQEDDDGSLPNPNGREFDNLYLDMNGIIHPCFHPEYDDVLLHQLNNPVTYEEVFNNVFEYIDRIMKVVRPRKLLYMAIDGVAPRAKMNQQRTRRYLTAKDRETLRKEEERLRRRYETEGRDVFPTEESEVPDSNVITPGTRFMYELSKRLQTYIRLRISTSPAWRRLKVILSDANAPGEGEHKIMSFIRRQRSCTGYNPNTSHVLYGLDADLIMLALATHEIHFSILRENVLMDCNKAISNSSVSFPAGKSEADAFDLNGGSKDLADRTVGLETSSKRKSVVKKPYQFLHVWILREYLKLDMRVTSLPEKFETDFERIVDDFVFICFFAGNDFLPHMPTLNIHEGAIDLLIHVYNKEFKNLGGYLVDVQRVEDKKGGYIKLKRVEKFIVAVGAYEERIFKKRLEIRDKKLRRMISDIEDARDNGEEGLFHEIGNTEVGSRNCYWSSSPDQNEQIVENTKMLKKQLKSYTCEISDVFRNGRFRDMVNLGSPGWKKRYYKNKFYADTEEDMENTRKNVVESYTQGLCWVLLYYFSGVPSWTWFFPFHYGPFASDMKGLSSIKVAFQRGLPFKPFDQLMAVLPPMSADALPLSYRVLMTDEGSDIGDFYPSEFDIDTDGKRFVWQGICKLPFIQEDRLLAATKKIEKDLTEEEAKRNAENVDRLFIHTSESSSICNDASWMVKQSLPISRDDIDRFVHLKLESENARDSNGLTNDHDVLCVYYDPPCFGLHIPRVLEGTTVPEAVVSEEDIEARQLWHENHGYYGQINRPYKQVQEAKRSPGVIIKGAGSGWIPQGRGKTHDFSPSSHGAARCDAIWTVQEQSGIPSWQGVYGRGGRGNENGGEWSGRTGAPMNGSMQWIRTVSTQATDSPGRTNHTNDRNWSARTGPGSTSYQGWNQWGYTQPRVAHGETNNMNERIWSAGTGPGSTSYQGWNTQPRDAHGEANTNDFIWSAGTGPGLISYQGWNRWGDTQPRDAHWKANNMNDRVWSAGTGRGSTSYQGWNQRGNRQPRDAHGEDCISSAGTGRGSTSYQGWNQRGRTQPRDAHGAANNANDRIWSARTGSGSTSYQGWNQWGDTQPRDAHGETNNTNDRIWSARVGSGSTSYRGWNQGGDTQPRDARGETNGRWRRVN